MNLLKTLITLLVGVFINGCAFNDPYSAKNVFTEKHVVNLAKAAQKGDIEKIDELLETGTNINSLGKDGLTPVYWSFLYVDPSPESKAGFEYLIKKGANLTSIHQPSKLPLLHMVSRADDSDYLEIILAYGDDLDLNFNADYWIAPSALANAMSARRFKNFEMLINNGASFGENSSGDESILENSTDSGTWHYALYLLEKGADYNAGKEQSKWNLEGLPEIVRSLENVNYWNYSGETSRDKVIEFLINKDVEVFPYHLEDDPRYNPRPHGFIINDSEPYFNFQTLLQTQTEETTDKYYDNYLAAKQFLTLIKRENAQTDDLETYSSKIKITAHHNFEKLFDSAFIDFFDANTGTTTRYTKRDISKELEKNEGPFRDKLAKLSYFYSQYSETKFVVTKDEKNLFIRLGASYGLLFTNEEKPKLLRIESYEIADM